MNIEALSEKFKINQRKFEHLETEAKYVINRSLEATDIKLHSITSRVKELQSFLVKAQRVEAENPFDEVIGIVGLRVICLFLSDIDRIGQVIRNSFSVLSEDNTIEGREVSSFGYMSVHFIAMMKKEYVGPRYDAIANLPFEIQVRTIAMDAWANVSHYLDYKSESDVPSDLRRDFYALSGLFYVADKHFEMFFGARNLSRSQLAERFAESKVPPSGEEINLDSLTAYLHSKLPNRRHSDSKEVSSLVRELASAGFKYIREVDDHLNRGAKAFAQFELERPLVPNKRFTDVGVVRVTLEISSDDYRKVKGVPDSLKRYRKLFK